MPRIATDNEYWEEVRDRLPEFMEQTYEPCEPPFCGVPARYVLKNFKLFIGKEGDVSYHTFYSELRRLGYEVPVAKGDFDSKTLVRGIRRKDIKL